MCIRSLRINFGDASRRICQLFIIAAALLCLSGTLSAGDGDTTIVSVFTENGIHWGDRTLFQNDTVSTFFGGRIIERQLTLPSFENPVRITAELEVIPDDGGVACSADPWDKAGNVVLLRPYEEPLELVKFITGYGGNTFHDEDVSFLATLLTGDVTIQAHIDTWLSPGWKVTLNIVYVEDSSYENPAWVTPVYYNQDLKRVNVSATDPSIDLDIPAGLDSFEVAYFTSGHSLIGAGGDEFITKANVIYANEVEVFRESPWRTNCTDFGSVNPCGNFPPSRSGWCPGDIVHPYRIDVSSELSAGSHVIRHSIEEIQANQGFWRVSSYLAGWASGETISPTAVSLSALQGTELGLAEETDLRIRLRDENGNWIYNAAGSVTLNSDNADFEFSDANGNWATSQTYNLNSGELVAGMRGQAEAENARVWATGSGLSSSDTLFFNVTRSFADTTGFNLMFDGNDDYVDAGNSESLRLTGNQITMEALIYVEQYKGAVWAGSIIVKDQGGAAGLDRGYMLRSGGNGELNINIGNGNWNELSSSPGVIPLQVWTHVAGTYDGERLRLYVNGNQIAESGIISVNIGDTDEQNLLIGESPQFPGRVWDGQIDEVRLWDVARSIDQLQSTMIGKLDSAYYASADSGLVGYWRFDDGEGQAVADLSVNGNHGTLGSSGDADVNDPVWVNANPSVGIEDEPVFFPQRYTLEQNYPNPFNPTTTIAYELPAAMQVKIRIYDVLGRQVTELVNDFKAGGRHLVSFDARTYPSGVYYYRLETQDRQMTKKMMLLK